MKRNPDIFIDVCELFAGSLMAFEDIYGYMSDFSDESLVKYIKDEWAIKHGTDLVIVMYKFEEAYWKRILPIFDLKILNHMRHYYTTDQGFSHPSYKDQILLEINEEIKARGH